MKVCATVPIKTNNQRVPGKNTRLLQKKPLYHYAFEELSQCSLIDDIYINTSDNLFLNIAKDWGFKTIIRPEELNSPEAHGNDIIKQSLEAFNEEYDIFILHHVTNPFITAKTINDCILSLRYSPHWTSIVPVVPLYDRLWCKGKEVNHTYKTLTGTQFMKPAYKESGLYVFRVNAFLEEQSRVTKNRMFLPLSLEEAFDIDTELDMRIAEIIHG